jgi:hypothetical protein
MIPSSIAAIIAFLLILIPLLVEIPGDLMHIAVISILDNKQFLVRRAYLDRKVLKGEGD